MIHVVACYTQPEYLIFMLFWLRIILLYSAKILIFVLILAECKKTKMEQIIGRETEIRVLKDALAPIRA